MRARAQGKASVECDSDPGLGHPAGLPVRRGLGGRRLTTEAGGKLSGQLLCALGLRIMTEGIVTGCDMPRMPLDDTIERAVVSLENFVLADSSQHPTPDAFCDNAEGNFRGLESEPQPGAALLGLLGGLILARLLSTYIGVKARRSISRTLRRPAWFRQRERSPRLRVGPLIATLVRRVWNIHGRRLRDSFRRALFDAPNRRHAKPRNRIAFVVGLLFGEGLRVSGANDPIHMLGFLDLAGA